MRIPDYVWLRPDGNDSMELTGPVDGLVYARQDEYCRWREDVEGGGAVWETDCNNAFYIEAGTPADNRMRFCPYCGRTLVNGK